MLIAVNPFKNVPALYTDVVLAHYKVRPAGRLSQMAGGCFALSWTIMKVIFEGGAVLARVSFQRDMCFS